MPFEVRMPALSPTMEKGTLAKWLVAPGDLVKAGDPIAEVETDKATMEIEAEQDGRLAEIRAPGGAEDIAVGTVIALLADVGEDFAEAVEDTPSAPEAPEAPKAEAPVAPRSEAVPQAVPQNAPPPRVGDKRATPLAARLAAIRGIALATIAGTGPGGKIVTADLGIVPTGASRKTTAEPIMLAATQAVASEPPEGVPVRREKLGSMRKTIARRLTEAKQRIPHFYLTVRCNLDPLLALRRQVNETLAAREIKVSVNDMLIKAMALALERIPDANVQFGGEELYRFDRIDVAMAVAIDGGLITPVLRDVGALSLSAIARESKTLAAKARDGKLQHRDYNGGTVSISNLGMYGVDEMVPVINPPQALILGTAAGIRQPWDVDGEIKLATIMAATASFDHRAIDGAVGAQFMAAFKDIVERPLLIVA